jgi:hypothetical protein
MPFTNGPEARITRWKGTVRVCTWNDRWQDCAAGVPKDTESCAADMNVCILFELRDKGVLPVIVVPDTPTTRRRPRIPFRSSLPCKKYASQRKVYARFPGPSVLLDGRLQYTPSLWHLDYILCLDGVVSSLGCRDLSFCGAHLMLSVETG